MESTESESASDSFSLSGKLFNREDFGIEANMGAGIKKEGNKIDLEYGVQMVRF